MHRSSAAARRAAPRAARALRESDGKLRDVLMGMPVKFAFAFAKTRVALGILASVSLQKNRSRVFCAQRIGRVAALVLPFAWCAAGPCRAATCSATVALDAKLQAHPSAEAYSERGIWFHDHRQYSCAAEDLQKALQLNPGSARLAYLLCHSLYSSGNAADAIGPLQDSVRLDPKMLKAHLTLGAALEQMNRTMDAEIEWRAALALEPKSATALAALSKDLLAEKNYSAEIALLRPISRANQLTPDLTLDLAMAYGQTGKLNDADEILRAALRAH